MSERRLRAVLRQLRRHRPRPRSAGSSSSAAGNPSAAAPDDDEASTAAHLARLERDGVTIVEAAFAPPQLAELRAGLQTACAEVAAALPSLEWSEMHYQPFFVGAPSFAVGKALYEGKRSAGYRGTEVIDLGRGGRHDFYGGVVAEQPALASAWRAPQLTALADGVLKHSWQPVGPGTLPTTTTSADAADSGGLWHRDAYPLFEDEAVDVLLPPYELTCLVPMQDLAIGEGATEFVLRSHRMNLSAAGLTSVEAVEAWAETQPRLEAAAPAGSAIVFVGNLLHRGAPVRSIPAEGSRRRDVLYFGYKKTWYSSEPDANFRSGSSHPGREV